ncbi:MAG: NADH-quinone oxidoreductase subunit L [Nitrospiraceae bacterium]|nr:NADH-quinone oxidoreductase subunit L [Nitrospiraceae bacterium]
MMLPYLWLIPALPFAGFLVLSVLGRRMGNGPAAAVGVGSVGLSALVAILVASSFINAPPPAHVYTQTLWRWISVGGFAPGVMLYLDSLSLIMVLVVTVVGFLIHLYSAEFMAADDGYSRFFAYMNLFVGSMLVLVLAGNLLFLYLGWEGVGLCSYLLIGFWYREPENGAAAIKAFVVTRVGDTALAIGLFLIFINLGTLDIQRMMNLAALHWRPGGALPTIAAALLLGGAIGKSAQLPLQTWLPDAMAGPTPVSALIHAATMVTAGVYLIARTNVLFTMAPAVQIAVAVIGAATLLVSGMSALVQHDIKRVLAYSTISQIGYMFVALGVGAWSAAIFHFMTHAFFKALLFLGAGAVIAGLGGEHDIFRMGGLRRQMPLAFWCFLAGACSLSALPLVTAGFYSKGLILSSAWEAGRAGFWLWAAAIAGALLTSIYTFRLVFIVFFGEAKAKISKKPGPRAAIPLVILAFLSVAGGFVNFPAFFGIKGSMFFSRFLASALPSATYAAPLPETDLLLEAVAAIVSLAGIYVAYFFFLSSPEYSREMAGTAIGKVLKRFWFEDWGFDWLYEKTLAAPYRWLARTNRNDAVDLFYSFIAKVNMFFHYGLSLSQTGKVRFYAAVIALGAVVTITIAVFAR